MPVYDWSETANNNANADPTVNWEIGMAPSAVGSSGRAMMAAVAAYRDDIAGAIVSSGTSTGYMVSSYSGYSSLALLAGQMIAFTPHTTNGAVVTLNVDSLGPKPLRSSPGVELLAGTIIQGTPYVAVYNNSDGAFYLRGFFGNPYNVPLGAGMPFFASTAPNSSFAFPYGQAISRATYATLFALVSTTYGTGDGSTTFNVPDLRGRVPAGMDTMGGTGAGRLTTSSGGLDGTTLGATSNNATHTLAASEIPSITSNGSNSLALPSGNYVVAPVGFANYSTQGGSTEFEATGVNDFSIVLNPSASGNVAVTSNNTGGAAHTIVQPTLVCNYIIRII
jgi:microcystin-dependent protein